MSVKRLLSLVDIPVGTRIHAITLTAIAGLLALALATVFQAKTTLINEAEARPHQPTESAFSVIKHFYDEAQAGRLTTEQAQAAAIGVIRAMRYDGGNYFAITSFEGI